MISPDAPGDNRNYLCDFRFNYKGTGVTVQYTVAVPSGPAVTAMTVTGGGIWGKLITHLKAHRLHYSQAIFEALDPATVVLLLAGYSYHGKPIATIVDAKPVTTAGNYLVFRMPVSGDGDARTEDEQEWARWLELHGVDNKPQEDIVPMPSGGVFAEAVLGRYNSAEKLDMTRFWNWQDSAIPLTAPEIAPIQAGSRAQESDLRAQPFSQLSSASSVPPPFRNLPAWPQHFRRSATATCSAT